MNKEVKNIYLGYELTQEEKELLYWLTMAEFAKPKHDRTTPYLLVKRILKNLI